MRGEPSVDAPPLRWRAPALRTLDRTAEDLDGVPPAHACDGQPCCSAWFPFLRLPLHWVPATYKVTFQWLHEYKVVLMLCASSGSHQRWATVHRRMHLCIDELAYFGCTIPLASAQM